MRLNLAWCVDLVQGR